MDVVRTHVERAGGQIEIETTNGRGTTFRLKMPLTLAIVPALLVEQSGQRFAVPRHAVSELVFLDDEQARTELQTVRGAPIARLRGEVLPLVRVGEALQMRPGQPPSGVTLVVMGTGQGRYALAVDDIKDTEEIVIKPLTGALKRLRCYSGAAVLGDGSIALVLDAAGLSALAGIDAASQREARAEAARTFAGPSAAPFLVFTAGDNAQCAVPLSRVARLEQLAASAVERVANREVIQYRGALLPLVRPEQHLPIGDAPASDDLHLVVLDSQPPLALVARAIVDVVQIELNASLMGRARPLTQGEAIAFGKATLLLDTRALQAAQADAQPERTAVLVVGAQGETSAFLREQGVQVIEADAAQAREQARTAARAVVADAESPLLAELRREYPLLPLLATAEEPSAQSAARARAAGAWACIARARKDELMAQLHAWGVPASAGGAEDRALPGTGANETFAHPIASRAA
jgi:chemotaxis signal transduction protein